MSHIEECINILNNISYTWNLEKQTYVSENDNTKYIIITQYMEYNKYNIILYHNNNIYTGILELNDIFIDLIPTKTTNIFVSNRDPIKLEEDGIYKINWNNDTTQNIINTNNGNNLQILEDSYNYDNNSGRYIKEKNWEEAVYYKDENNMKWLIMQHNNSFNTRRIDEYNSCRL